MRHLRQHPICIGVLKTIFIGAIFLCLPTKSALARTTPQEPGWGVIFDYAEYASDIAVDSQGNVFVAGKFGEAVYGGQTVGIYVPPVDFDPGPCSTDTQSDGDKPNSFVCKFNRNGEFEWVQTWDAEDVSSIALDPVGNIFVTGAFSGLTDFAPGDEEAWKNTTGKAASLYLLKLDPDGKLIWVRTWGGTDFIEEKNWDSTIIGITSNLSSGLEVDNDGNPYVAGEFCGSVDFDPGDGSDIHTSVDRQDKFLCKFDPDGNLQWACTWGGGNGISDLSRDCSLALSAEGYSYVTSNFFGSVDFDPGTAESRRVTDYEPASEYWQPQAYLSEFSPQGNFLRVMTWPQERTTYDEMHSYGITIDKFRGTGDVYLCGDFCGQVDFDPGPRVEERLSSRSTFMDFNDTNGEYVGSTDPFILKLSSNGRFRWVTTWGGWEANRSDCINSVAVDTQGNVYGGGYFTSPGKSIDKPDDDSRYMMISLDRSGQIRWVNNWEIGDRNYGDVLTDSMGYVYLHSRFPMYDEFADFPASFAPFINGSLNYHSEYLFKLMPDCTFDGQ